MRKRNRLGLVREALRLSRADMAKNLGVTLSTYSNYERGDRTIPDELKQNLSHFGVNLHWLLTGEGPMFLEDNNQPAAGETPQEDTEKEASTSPPGKKTPHELLRLWIDSLTDEEAQDTIELLLTLPILKPRKKREKKK